MPMAYTQCGTCGTVFGTQAPYNVVFLHVRRVTLSSRTPTTQKSSRNMFLIHRRSLACRRCMKGYPRAPGEGSDIRRRALAGRGAWPIPTHCPSPLFGGFGGEHALCEQARKRKGGGREHGGGGSWLWAAGHAPPRAAPPREAHLREAWERCTARRGSQAALRPPQPAWLRHCARAGCAKQGEGGGAQLSKRPLKVSTCYSYLGF